jgi:ribosomal protein S27AE
VEVKNFLKNTENLTGNLLIRYCFKVARPCPQCGQQGLCQGGAISLYSRHLDKITHEIKSCLNCGHKELSTLLTIESL